MDNVTDIRTMAEARLHRGVRPSGLIRRDGTRLEPGEIQEIQVTAERGGQVRPDQVLGMIEVIEALSRRAYARFQQVADAREELATERMKIEDLQAQSAIQAAEHKMYVDRVAELDTRLANARAENQLRIEELEGQLAQRRYTDEDIIDAQASEAELIARPLRARIADLEGQLKRMDQAGTEAADIQLAAARQRITELERSHACVQDCRPNAHVAFTGRQRIIELEGKVSEQGDELKAKDDLIRHLRWEKNEAIRQMGVARDEYATASRIATENGEALAEQTDKCEAYEQDVAKIRAIVWATEGLDKVIERRGDLDSEPAKSLVAVVSRVRAVIGQ